MLLCQAFSSSPLVHEEATSFFCCLLSSLQLPSSTLGECTGYAVDVLLAQTCPVAPSLMVVLLLNTSEGTCQKTMRGRHKRTTIRQPPKPARLLPNMGLG